MSLQNALVILSSVLAVLVLGAVIIIYMSFRIGAQARLNRRIDSLLETGDLTAASEQDAEARQRRRSMQARIREIEERQQHAHKASALQGELLQSGLEWTVRKFWLISLGAGVAAMALSFLFGFRPFGSGWLAAIPIGLTFGLGVPRWTLRWLGGRRLKKFTDQFADAVDVIIRGIQSGLPVDECLNIIARESPDPTGFEFRLITEGQRLGIPYDEMLRRAIERIPTAELKFFAIVLGIQRQTGGNLAETLQNLSNVLRERERIFGVIRAASSEARMSAMIIGAMPFFTAGLMILANRDYVATLINDPLGHVLIIIGGSIMALGIFIMKQMITIEV